MDKRFDDDTYEGAFKQLTDSGLDKPVADEPMEDPAPKVTPEKEAAMASSASEAKAFSDAWNGEPASAQEKEDIKKMFAADAPQVPKQSFGAAFKAARKDGAKTFEFNGKKYSTALKSDKPAAKAPSAASQMPAPRDDQAKPAATTRRPGIYEAENPIRSGVNAIKKAVGFVADGGLNLTKK